MSVQYALLGLLEREPSHGYELKRNYDALFGKEKPVPYGQIYSTLSRLAKNGLVSAGDFERGGGPDRRCYAITAQGEQDLDSWLSAPALPEPHLQTVLFVKVVLALLLDRDPYAYLDAQRALHHSRMRDLTGVRRLGTMPEALLADYAIFHLEADLHWMDVTEARLESLRGEIFGETAEA